MPSLAECLVTRRAFVRFLAAVNSPVNAEVARVRESFAANGALERLLSRMTPPVFRQVATTATTSAAFRALVFTFVNIHVLIQGDLRRIAFLTLSARIPVLSTVSFSVNFQRIFRTKPFVTHSTQIRPRLVITRMLSVITAISFNLNFNGTFTCITSTTQYNQKHFRTSCFWHKS